MLLPPATPVRPPVPSRQVPLLRLLGRVALRVLGFRIEGTIPAVPRILCVVAPHTSNWDFPVGIATVFALRLRASWMGKAELFRFPFAALFRVLGGIPIDRRNSHGVVEQTIAAFRDSDALFLAIAPQGTRRRGAEWRMGFYHIAHGASVPLLPVSIDYARGVLEIGELFETTGQLEADVQALKAFFQDVQGRHGKGPTGN